jgi:quercetin dioxygenase-like cupin family protein
MEIETLITKTPLSEDSMSINSSLFTFDLPTLVENMKHSQTWAKGELYSMILLKTPEKQIVLTALHKETEINSYQANDSITLEIIEGKLKFHTRKESVILNKGQVLTLHENIKYSLTTREETVLLLTIANGIFHRAEN